MNKVGC